MYCWIEPLNGYTICTHTPPSEACGGLCDRPRNLVTRSPPAYRLSFSFSIKCGRILGRDSCWLSLLNSFHFRAASTVELLSELPKLILTISSRERGSYRGALQYRFETKPAARHLSQRGPFLLHRLLRGNHVQVTARSAVPIPVVAKRVSQKIQAGAFLLQIDNPCFLPVDLQSHPLFQFRFDELGYRLRLIPCQNDKIVGVAYQLGLRPLPRPFGSMKHLIEPVQIDIRQQG